MKKFFVALLAFALIIALCGCNAAGLVPAAPSSSQTASVSVPSSSGNVTEAPKNAPEEAGQSLPEVSGAAEAPAEPAAPDASGSSVSGAPLKEDESADKYISIAFSESGEYSDIPGNKYNYSYIIPCFTLSGGDVEQINQNIYDVLYPEIEENLKSMKDGFSIYLIDVGYDAYLNGSVLSLVCKLRLDFDISEYYIWNLNIETGKLFSDEELFDMTGMGHDGTSLLDVTAACVGRYCTENTPDLDVSFVREQYEKTISTDNLSQARYFFDENGDLQCFVRIFSVAGAGYYYRIIPLTR